MHSKTKEKKFDAVKMMREIRDELSKQYVEKPEVEDSDLELIREKYGVKPQKKQSINTSTNKLVQQKLRRKSGKKKQVKDQPKCGLCSKTKNLAKTECCNEWYSGRVCQDHFFIFFRCIAPCKSTLLTAYKNHPAYLTQLRQAEIIKCLI